MTDIDKAREALRREIALPYYYGAGAEIAKHIRMLMDALDRLSQAEADARMYRFLRGHFRFANDSLRELWYDAHTSVNDDDARVLDAEIDKAMRESA